MRNIFDVTNFENDMWSHWHDVNGSKVSLISQNYPKQESANDFQIHHEDLKVMAAKARNQTKFTSLESPDVGAVVEVVILISL